MREIKVVLGILSYNFASNIGKAIESMLVQETDFPFRIVVVDDCSSDGSQEIIAKYAREFGDIITADILPENTRGRISMLRLINHFKGADYCSILDGDDYWLGTTRLQKQIDFLEANPEYSMCGGITKIVFQNGDFKFAPYAQADRGTTYTFADFIVNPDLFHTSSVIYRNLHYNKGIPQNMFQGTLYGSDNFTREDNRMMLHLEAGPMFCLDEVVSCYNHGVGYYSSTENYHRLLLDALRELGVLIHYRDRYPELYPTMYNHYKMLFGKCLYKLFNENLFFPNIQLTLEETKLLARLLVLAKEYEDLEDSLNPDWRPLETLLTRG